MTITWKSVLHICDSRITVISKNSAVPERQNSKRSDRRKPQITIINEKSTMPGPKEKKRKNRTAEQKSSGSFLRFPGRKTRWDNQPQQVNANPQPSASATAPSNTPTPPTAAAPSPAPPAVASAAVNNNSTAIPAQNIQQPINTGNQNQQPTAPAADATASAPSPAEHDIPDGDSPPTKLKETPDEPEEIASPTLSLPRKLKTTVCVVDDEGDLLLECIPDDYDPSDPSELEIRAFKVCSHILRRCSPVFRRMFSPNSAFAESTVHADGLKHASVTCHAASMEIMLNIVHYRRDKIPKDRQLSADALKELAVFSDQYDVPDASVSYVDHWTQPYITGTYGATKVGDLADLLLVAFVFKLPTLFTLMTRDLAIRTVWKDGVMWKGAGVVDLGYCAVWNYDKEMEEVVLSDLLPPSLQDAIHEIHKKALSQLLDAFYEPVKEYLKEEEAMTKEGFWRSTYGLNTKKDENGTKETFLVDSSFYYTVTKMLKRCMLDARDIMRLKDGTAPTSSAVTVDPIQSTAAQTTATETTDAEGEKAEVKKEFELPVSMEFLSNDCGQINSLYYRAEVKRDSKNQNRGMICATWFNKVVSIVSGVRGLELKDFVRD